jgi:hypothetical protein
MNADDPRSPSDDALDALFRTARPEAPHLDRVAFAFETRLMARLREERADSWTTWAWRLCPALSLLAMAALAWGYFVAGLQPDLTSLYAAVRSHEIPALTDWYSATR